ncbi:MAG: hypothetical protein ACLUHE_16770 [Christensenellales bacterium]
MIVANDVTRPGAGFDVDTNIVTLITKDGQGGAADDELRRRSRSGFLIARWHSEENKR